ncbi:MAG: hypothetical protein ACI83W_002716 [Marinoscillum sp.]|jgi:hypothetical protein
MRKHLYTILISLIFLAPLSAQDDLLASLEAEQVEEKSFVEATFKGTRIINGHSIETRKKGVMDFIIAHRFGTIDGGAYELFGLDNAFVRIGLEYAITDQLYVGLGRSSFEKTFDGFVKYRLLRQSTGEGSMPLSVTWLSSLAIKTQKDPTTDLSFVDKLANTHQLMVARKLNSAVSLQFTPTWVHRNLIGINDLRNDIFALGVGGRVKLSQRFALSLEYYKQFQKLNDNTKDAIAIGVDIETGGHVFQLQFTNATSMIPKGFISETTNDFFKNQIHFGFNISRTFQVN